MAESKLTTVSVRADPELYRLLARDAKRDKRSIGNQALYILAEYYRAKGELNGEDEKAD